MPYLLEEKGWIVPQAAELQVYLREIIASWNGSPNALAVLSALPQLRHAAVHRIPISPAKMEEFFALAEHSATFLGDNSADSKISRMRTLFNRDYMGPKDGREAMINMMDGRLKHLELVKREIRKEELWWKSVAPKLEPWRGQAAHGELQAALQEGVDNILLPEGQGKPDPWEREQENKEDDCSNLWLHYGMVVNFQPWEFVDTATRAPHTCT